MPEFELLLCSMHRFEGNLVPQGVQAGKAQEQGITKGWPGKVHKQHCGWYWEVGAAADLATA